MDELAVPSEPRKNSVRRMLAHEKVLEDLLTLETADLDDKFIEPVAKVAELRFQSQMDSESPPGESWLENRVVRMFEQLIWKNSIILWIAMPPKVSSTVEDSTI